MKALLISLALALLSLIPWQVRAQSFGSAQDSAFSAQRLIHTATDAEVLCVYNHTVAAPDTTTIFLGKSGLTTATGFRVVPGTYFCGLQMGRGQKLYVLSKAAGDSGRVSIIWGSPTATTP
jgi:hypothetical protein